MLACCVCGCSDRVMELEGVALCWVCRRIDEVKQALGLKQTVRDNITQQFTTLPYGKPAKVLIAKEVKDLWQRIRQKEIMLS